MSMPVQKPGKSRQDYETPNDFLGALANHLGIHSFFHDLAADEGNTVAPTFYDIEDNALEQSWATPVGAWNFCNPPFAKIAPWVRKANEEKHHSQTAMLLPAGVGSNWWRNHVHNKAYVLLVSPRLTFKGETQTYPKDLVVLLWTPFLEGGYTTWRWI